MNAENSKDTKTRDIPEVDFHIEVSKLGMKAGFNPKGNINGVDLVALLGAGVYTLCACIGEKFNIPIEDVWDMVQVSVGIVQSELGPPEMVKEDDNEI